MLPYFAAYITMFMLALFGEISREKGFLSRNAVHKLECTFFAVLWTVLLGLRHPSMGVDLAYGTNNGYWMNYVHIGRLPWKYVLLHGFQNYEVGYRILNKVLYTVCSNPQLLLFVCAAASMITAAWSIYKNSDLPFLSGILYLGLPVFLSNFSALRQSVAISITLFSFYFIRQKKPFKFLLTILTATLFHYTSIILLAAYPVYHLKMRKWMTWGSVMIVPILYLLKGPLFLVLGRLLKDQVHIANTSAGFLFLIFYLIYIFSVVFENKDDKDETGVRNLFYCAVCCQIFASVSQTATRVTWYFMPYLVLLLPRIIRNNSRKNVYYSKRNTVIMYLAILICFSAFGYSMLSSPGWAQSNPYHFFWN